MPLHFQVTLPASGEQHLGLPFRKPIDYNTIFNSVNEIFRDGRSFGYAYN
jgi:hypothetical protein